MKIKPKKNENLPKKNNLPLLRPARLKSEVHRAKLKKKK